MERSLAEKQLLRRVIRESAQLDYPLIKKVSEEYGEEYVYDIPSDEIEKVVKEIYPFVNRPEMDEELFDLHSTEMTSLRKCKVIRWSNRNIIVSEMYFEFGGTLIDLVKK